MADHGTVTTGQSWATPDLSRVDEIGFADLLPGSGHGWGGFVNLARASRCTASASRAEGAATPLGRNAVPPVMAFPALLPVVRNFEANPIRVLEEGRAVVACVVGIQPRVRGLDSERAEFGPPPYEHPRSSRHADRSGGAPWRKRPPSRTRETASARSRNAD